MQVGFDIPVVGDDDTAEPKAARRFPELWDDSDAPISEIVCVMFEIGNFLHGGMPRVMGSA